MRQQLYIDGVAVDMPTEQIKFCIESNVMSDAGSVKTAHSYSITLPRTMTNDSLLAMAYVPAMLTGGKSTHRYMKASLHLDGVPLFDEGYCCVDAVEDKGYKVSLFWGLLGLFDLIKSEGLDVCDLWASSELSGTEDTTSWLQLTEHLDTNQYVSGMNSTIYDTLDSDSKTLASYLPWCLPVVSANEVLAAITTCYGLTLDISATAQERIDEIYHAPTTLKSLAKDEVCVINLRSEYYKSGSLWYLGIKPSPTWLVDYAYLPPLLYDNPPSAYNSASNKWAANNALIIGDVGFEQLLANSKIEVKKVRVFGSNPTAFSVDVNGETATSTNAGGSHSIDHTFTDEFSVDAGGYLLQLHSNTSSSTQIATAINVQVWVSAIDLSTKWMTSGGGWWSYARNLPQMGVVAYLNELLAHTGCCIVGSVTKPTALRIVTLDEIAAAPPQTLDLYGVKSIKMSFEKLAQRNEYLHKSNDDNGVDYEGKGYIYTNDSTLELSRKAFDSKFRVPMNTMVRLWKVEKNDNNSNYKATWAGGSDYIGGYDSDAGVFRNTGQDFTRIIASYYTAYAAIMERPKTLEVMVRLDFFGLRDFDFERPVYIKQLGRSYIVIKVETESGDTYKLTLLQI